MSTQQGSASYVIVIATITAILVGAFTLTLFFFPVTNAFMASPHWQASTVPGTRVLTYVGGLWEFWPLIILLAIMSYVIVRTRR